LKQNTLKKFLILWFRLPDTVLTNHMRQPTLFLPIEQDGLRQTILLNSWPQTLSMKLLQQTVFLHTSKNQEEWVFL